MKKILPFITLLLFVFSTLSAQQQRMMNRENIKLLKTSYLTDALDLTLSEAEKFWPVYNLYSEKNQSLKFELESGMFRKINSAGGIDDISESEAKSFIDDGIKTEQEIAANRTKMTQELLKILPAKKVLKLKKAEKDFNRRILQEYGKRRGAQKNN